MATNYGSLAQELIDAGLSPALSKLIANAIANAATPQFTIGSDRVDATPAEKLRLVTADARRYELTNLDYSPQAPFEDRLSNPRGAYTPQDADHPYKGSQPVNVSPTLAQPAIVGSDYIEVEQSISGDNAVSTVSLDVRSVRGQHLRLDAATKTLDSVPITAVSQTPKYITATVDESSDATEIRVGARATEEVSIALEDGSTRPMVAWPAGNPVANGAFTGWAKNNLLNKTSGAEVQRAIGSPAAWVNIDGAVTANITGTYSQTLTVVTVNITNHGLTVGNAINVDITSGSAVDGARTVASVINANQFTYTATSIATPTSGNITLICQSVRASSNVTRVTRWGVGDWTINFRDPLADANYALCGAGKFTDFTDTNVPVIGMRRVAGNPTANWVRINSVVPNSPATGFDCPVVTVTIFD